MALVWLRTLAAHKWSASSAGVFKSDQWQSTAGWEGPVALELVATGVGAAGNEALVEIYGRNAGSSEETLLKQFPVVGGKSIVSTNAPLTIPLQLTWYPAEIVAQVTLRVSSGASSNNTSVTLGVAAVPNVAGGRQFVQEFDDVTVNSLEEVLWPYPVGHLKNVRIWVANNSGGAVLTAFTVAITSRQTYMDASSVVTSAQAYTHADVTTIATLAAGSEHSFLLPEGVSMVRCMANCGTTTDVTVTVTGEEV